MGDYIVTRLTTNAEGKRQNVRSIKAVANDRPGGRAGRMRVARAGATAVLSACDAGGELRELYHVPLGTEDVTRLRVGLNPRNAKLMEARLLGLRVTGPAAAPAEKAAPAEGPPG